MVSIGGSQENGDNVPLKRLDSAASQDSTATNGEPLRKSKRLREKAEKKLSSGGGGRDSDEENRRSATGTSAESSKIPQPTRRGRAPSVNKKKPEPEVVTLDDAEDSPKVLKTPEIKKSDSTEKVNENDEGKASVVDEQPKTTRSRVNTPARGTASAKKTKISVHFATSPPPPPEKNTSDEKEKEVVEATLRGSGLSVHKKKMEPEVVTLDDEEDSTKVLKTPEIKMSDSTGNVNENEEGKASVVDEQPKTRRSRANTPARGTASAKKSKISENFAASPPPPQEANTSDEKEKEVVEEVKSARGRRSRATTPAKTPAKSKVPMLVIEDIDVDPIVSEKSCSRSTRTSSRAREEVAMEAVSKEDQEPKTPRRGRKPQPAILQIEVIDIEEEDRKKKEEEVLVKTPRATRASSRAREQASPARSTRSTTPARKEAASPTRLTRAMRQAGMTTPGQEESEAPAKFELAPEQPVEPDSECQIIEDGEKDQMEKTTEDVVELEKTEASVAEETKEPETPAEEVVDTPVAEIVVEKTASSESFEESEKTAEKEAKMPTKEELMDLLKYTGPIKPKEPCEERQPSAAPETPALVLAEEGPSTASRLGFDKLADNLIRQLYTPKKTPAKPSSIPSVLKDTSTPIPGQGNSSFMDWEECPTPKTVHTESLQPPAAFEIDLGSVDSEDKDLLAGDSPSKEASDDSGDKAVDNVLKEFKEKKRLSGERTSSKESSVEVDPDENTRALARESDVFDSSSTIEINVEAVDSPEEVLDTSLNMEGLIQETDDAQKEIEEQAAEKIESVAEDVSSVDDNSLVIDESNKDSEAGCISIKEAETTPESAEDVIVILETEVSKDLIVEEIVVEEKVTKVAEKNIEDVEKESEAKEAAEETSSESPAPRATKTLKSEDDLSNFLGQFQDSPASASVLEDPETRELKKEKNVVSVTREEPVPEAPEEGLVEEPKEHVESAVQSETLSALAEDYASEASQEIVKVVEESATELAVISDDVIVENSQSTVAPDVPLESSVASGETTVTEAKKAESDTSVATAVEDSESVELEGEKKKKRQSTAASASSEATVSTENISADVQESAISVAEVVEQDEEPKKKKKKRQSTAPTVAVAPEVVSEEPLLVPVYGETSVATDVESSESVEKEGEKKKRQNLVNTQIFLGDEEEEKTSVAPELLVETSEVMEVVPVVVFPDLVEPLTEEAEGIAITHKDKKKKNKKKRQSLVNTQIYLGDEEEEKTSVAPELLTETSEVMEVDPEVVSSDLVEPLTEEVEAVATTPKDKKKKNKKKKRQSLAEEKEAVVEVVEIPAEETSGVEKKKKKRQKRQSLAGEEKKEAVVEVFEEEKKDEIVEIPAEETSGVEKKKKKRKKRQSLVEEQKKKAVVEVFEEEKKDEIVEIPAEETSGVEKKKKKRKKSLAIDSSDEAQVEVKKAKIDEEVLEAAVEIEEQKVEEAVKEKKTKKKQKKAAVKETVPEIVVEQENVEEAAEAEAKKSKKKKKKAKKMVVAPEEEVEAEVEAASGSVNYPTLSFKKLVAEPELCSSKISAALSALYNWSCKQKRHDDLPDKFLNDDDETVYQFVAHKGKQIKKDFRKFKSLLDDPIACPWLEDEEKEIEDEEFDQDLEDEEAMDVDDEAFAGDEEDEDEVDLFNLRGEDLKDLERELAAMDNENDEDDDAGSSSDKENGEEEKPKKQQQKKKFPKSVVDDKFFNLAEMDAFCDDQEKQNDDEGILATVDDTWGGPADYHYEDFFGKLDDVVGEDTSAHKKTKKRKADDSDSNLRKKKSVRFAMDEEEEQEEHEEEMDEENGEPDGDEPVLLGNAAQEEKVESKLKADIRKLKESIRKLEQENLEPRSWELSGEVTAQQRGENALLDTHVQFDNTSKRAPEVTEDFTEKLEALIKQRIKDQAFDDVVRIKKIDEKVDVYRNDAIEEMENMKKSLSEVYEKEYQKAAGQVEAVSAENEQHKAIQAKVDRLFQLIDAMSHFEYTPPQVRPEIRVVSNMPALRVEEVGMMASTDAQLLAPEEMKKRQKGDLKADDERTSTDKLRQRRKKKIKQRAMVLTMGADKALAGQIEKKIKKKTKKVGGADKTEESMKSTNFFSKLQDTVQKELKQKTTKKTKKVKSEKASAGGAKFKL